MKRLLFVLLMVGFLVAPVSAFLADVPTEMREENWWGPVRGEGSCAWASTVMALRYAGQDPLATWYRDHHGDGAHATQLMNQATAYKLAFSATEVGSREWMEWAISNRLVICCAYYPGHMINVVGSTDTLIVILDNNHIDKFRYVEKEVFYAKWRRDYSGFAMCFLYKPLPPWPINP